MAVAAMQGATQHIRSSFPHKIVSIPFKCKETKAHKCMFMIHTNNDCAEIVENIDCWTLTNYLSFVNF